LTEKRAPRERRESIDVETADGVKLRADVREPPWRTARRGTLILAHAMMAHRGEYERAGFARFFASRGWRTVAFDFRGHGDSERRDDGGYDDFVQRDLPAIVQSARFRTKTGPVVVVGHSLGAHTSLASQAIGALEADALVSIAGSIWLRAYEPSAARWLLKRGAFKALKLGSDAEARPDLTLRAQLTRVVEEGAWTSDDGARDYRAALPQVTVPIFALASRGDLLVSPPDSVAAMMAETGAPITSFVIERSDDGGAAPGHMEIVTTDRGRSAWERVADWLRQLA
jgi:alpha-beta hydrolase superfamily lysophospholipase